MGSRLVPFLGNRDYIDIVGATGPVFYCPMQGAKVIEVVRGVVASVSATAPLAAGGPFQGAQAWRFSANVSDNDSFTVPSHASYHPGNTFSVGGWVNQVGNGGTFPAILSAGNQDLNPGVNNAGSFVLGQNGVGNIFVSTATFKGTGWRHVIFTKSGATTICYVDGVSVAGTTTDLTIVAGSSDIKIGATHQGGTDFDGYLAHLAIWRRVLTAGEVRALYLRGVA